MSQVKLASRQCKSCVFKTFSVDDLQRLRNRWGEFGHQTCHQFRIQGERGRPDVWCRGYWDSEAPQEFKDAVLAMGLVDIVEQRKRDARR